jgi:hypothetical protein
VPQETSPLSDNAPLVTSHFSWPITKQTDEALADTSIPFLGAEDDQWTPGIVLARILEMKDPSERERYYIHIRTQTAALSLPILTVHYLLRGHFARVNSCPSRILGRFLISSRVRGRHMTLSFIGKPGILCAHEA